VSHFTRLRTKIVDGDILEGALKELQYDFERGRVTIGGYRGQSTEAEFRIATKARGYDIGMRHNGRDSYEIVADWWGVRGFTQEGFVKAVQHQYAVSSAKLALQDQGFTLAEESREKDGAIRLVLQRFV
jgi:hypothetical protein